MLPFDDASCTCCPPRRPHHSLAGLRIVRRCGSALWGVLGTNIQGRQHQGTDCYSIYDFQLHLIQHDLLAGDAAFLCLPGYDSNLNKYQQIN